MLIGNRIGACRTRNNISSFAPSRGLKLQGLDILDCTQDGGPVPTRPDPVHKPNKSVDSAIVRATLLMPWSNKAYNVK